MYLVRMIYPSIICMHALTLEHRERWLSDLLRYACCSNNGVFHSSDYASAAMVVAQTYSTAVVQQYNNIVLQRL